MSEHCSTAACGGQIIAYQLLLSIFVLTPWHKAKCYQHNMASPCYILIVDIWYLHLYILSGPWKEPISCAFDMNTHNTSGVLNGHLRV